MSKRKLSLKWIGSLTNLSIRRSSDKTNHKAAPKHEGKSSASAVGEQSVDDMESSLHNPGYACSSDMYTHVGTLPRPRSCKGPKKKGDGKAEGGKSQCQAGEQVRDSPLLGALSSSILPSLDRPLPVSVQARALPATPMPTHSPPPTSDTLASHRGFPDPRTPSAEVAQRHVEDQTEEQQTAEPPEALQEVEALDRPPMSGVRDGHRPAQRGVATTTTRRQLDSMESSGEYVKFSKEKFWLEPPSEKLRKELEEELKLSSSNLRSHAWYHGCIPWEVSESLVVNHGDFIIRDSMSNQGDYVLTSHWSQSTLHFLISKTLVQSSETYTRVQFTLEGEAFDSVPALVHFYVGNRAALTRQSGAQIHRPVNRTLPLSYLETAFARAGCKGSAVSSPSCLRGWRKGSGNGVDKGCPWRGADASCSLDQDQPQTTGEAPLAAPHNNNHFLWQLGESGCDVLRDVVRKLPHQSAQRHYDDAMFPRTLDKVLQILREGLGWFALKSSHVDDVGHGGAGELEAPQSRSPCSSISLLAVSMAPPPSLPGRCGAAQPRPSPNNTLHRQCSNGPQLPLKQDRLLSDVDRSSYTELYPSPQSYVERLCAEDGLGVDPLRAENGNVYSIPVVETVSSFRPCRYQSQLMPKVNKPLEEGILRRVKGLLAEVDPKTAAKHITKADCTVARVLEVSPEVQRMMGVSSGMELLTLPHGQQLRLDLLERFQTMAIMLAVNVLGCTGTTEERASLLHKTIQIAAELKSNMGNMFGFAAIMRALAMPQVSRLEQTWTVLRQRHTEGAILYEKTLKPFMKSLNDGRESCPLSSTTFPHVVPLLSLLEKSAAVGEGAEPWETVEAGVDVVMSHLGAARTIAQLGGIYRSNAETRLQGFQEQPEVLELFLTDFQMRLLYGSRGAAENQAQRYAKFDQVLTILSNKLEPNTPARRPVLGPSV
ncbi:SH2 domain containing 3Cb [Diretmus argenteus]